jgi:type II secretory pathway pseudopilin PulG
MIELIIAIYAAVCVIATVGFIGFGLASRRNQKSDILQTIEALEEAIADSRSDFSLQAADSSTDARKLSEPCPTLVRSHFPTRSKATSAM